MPNVLIDTNVDGQELVPAPGEGKFIRVHGWDVTADGQVTVTLKSNDTVKWKTYSTNDANVRGGIVKPFNLDGWFDCALNEPLKIGLDAAESVAGGLYYSIRS